MAIKRIQLTDSQHEGWEHHLDNRAVSQAKEKRFLAYCLTELGGRMNEPWQFDEHTETFWINIPDDKEPHGPADTGTAASLDKDLA